MEDIDAGLPALIDEIKKRGISSVPPLGCGLGGLNWSDVRPRSCARLKLCLTCECFSVNRPVRLSPDGAHSQSTREVLS
jgi:hypothetical protein